MFSILQTPQARNNERAEGFGVDQPIKELYDIALLPGIKDYQTVCFKPLCGIFMQATYLPLRYAPIEIELSLSDTTEPIVSEQTCNFKTANTSYQYKLEKCMLKCDVCTLDDALDNNYASRLLSGKSLNIVYDAFAINIQTMLTNGAQVNISRSVSALKSVFLPLEKYLIAGTECKTFFAKQWNNFYSPRAVDTNTHYPSRGFRN